MSNEEPRRQGGQMPNHESPATDEASIEEALREISAQAIGSITDTIHLFYAVTGAVDQLNAGTVLCDLESEFEWFRLINHGGALGEYTGLSAPEQHDRMADFDKRAGALLQHWMFEHGLTEVTLNVWMPCHSRYHPFTVRSDGAPYHGVRAER